MNLRSILGIVGAITAAVATVPAIVGIFRPNSPPPPTITNTGDAAVINTGSGTVNNVTNIDKSNNTFISSYVKNWRSGVDVVTQGQFQSRAATSGAASSSTSSLRVESGTEEKSRTDGHSAKSQSPASFGPQPKSAGTDGSSDSTRSMRPSCLIACISKGANACKVQTENGTLYSLDGIWYMRLCDSLYIVQGQVEGVAWTPLGQRLNFKEKETGAGVVRFSISRADEDALTRQCVFSPDRCGNFVRRANEEPNQGLVSLQLTDYLDATDERDRREFNHGELGMVAALLRKGYYWDAAHFTKIQNIEIGYPAPR